MYQRRITTRSAPWPDLLAAIYHAEAAGEGGRPRAGAEEPGLPAGTRGIGGETPAEFLGRGRCFLPVPRGFWCRLGKSSSRRGRGEAFSLAAHRGWGRGTGARHRSGRAGGCRSPSGPGTSHGAHPWGTPSVSRGSHRCHQTPAATPGTPSPCGAGTPGCGRAAQSGEGAWKRLKWGERGEKPRNGAF